MLVSSRIPTNSQCVVIVGLQCGAEDLRDRYAIVSRNEIRDVDTVGNTSRILSGSGLESTENAAG
jgi:hypothetical protein